MAKEEYVDRAGLIVYDRLTCLRNEYAFNSCEKCIDICPENAFLFVRKKLRLDSQKCNSCGVCIGSCPSNALFLVGESLPVQKILNEDNATLTCQNQESCLAKYTQFDYIVLALEAKKSFTCNLFTCKECEINKNSKIESLIEKNIEEANIVLQKISPFMVKKSLKFIPDPFMGRRAFFRSLLKPLHVKENIGIHINSLERVKKSLKENLLHAKETLISKPLSFSHHKNIDDNCTNCGECIEFCPTKALSYSSDKTKIIFQTGKCIGCKICEDICKPKAIMSIDKEFDLVDFAYEKMEILCEHELRICKVCKCSFSYKSGDEICERCESFEKEHADMFTLASNKL